MATSKIYEGRKNIFKSEIITMENLNQSKFQIKALKCEVDGKNSYIPIWKLKCVFVDADWPHHYYTDLDGNPIEGVIRDVYYDINTETVISAVIIEIYQKEDLHEVGQEIFVRSDEYNVIETCKISEISWRVCEEEIGSGKDISDSRLIKELRDLILNPDEIYHVKKYRQKIKVEGRKHELFSGEIFKIK